MKKIGMAIAAFLALFIANAYYAYNHSTPTTPLQVTVTVTPNGHVTRLTANRCLSMEELDIQIDKALEGRPDLWCTSVQIRTCFQAVLLCTNVQNHTGPP